MVLKELKEYILNFVGLKLGLHHFEYLITNSFFEAMQSEETLNTNIKLDLEFDKQVNLMTLKFNFSGNFETICDRCADPLTIPVEFSETLYFNISENETSGDDDDVISISPSDYEIDISQFVYEFIMVSIPMKRVHLDDAEGNSLCNEETLRLFEESKSKSIDPRWEILNKLKNEN